MSCSVSSLDGSNLRRALRNSLLRVFKRRSTEPWTRLFMVGLFRFSSSERRSFLSFERRRLLRPFRSSPIPLMAWCSRAWSVCLKSFIAPVARTRDTYFKNTWVSRNAPRQLSTFLKRLCNRSISSRFDTAWASSSVAIKRLVLTRRSCTDFSEALARAFFHALENASQDLSNDDKKFSGVFMEC